jgi:hypothetical protein
MSLLLGMLGFSAHPGPRVVLEGSEQRIVPKLVYMNRLSWSCGQCLANWRARQARVSGYNQSCHHMSLTGLERFV